MDVSILEDLGLTNAEIKIYLALLELGVSTAGPIIRKTGLQNSVVHATLPRMVEKGLVTYIIKGKRRHYQASDPRNIVNFIEEKKKRFETILPALLAKQSVHDRQEAQVYEGFRGFKMAMYELTRDFKSGDEYLFFAFHGPDMEKYRHIYAFFLGLEKERKKTSLPWKGIVPKDIKYMLKGRDMRKLIFVDFPIPVGITFCGDKVVLAPTWEDRQVCFLIQSRQLAESLRSYFYSIWNKYKK